MNSESDHKTRKVCPRDCTILYSMGISVIIIKGINIVFNWASQFLFQGNKEIILSDVYIYISVEEMPGR